MNIQIKYGLLASVLLTLLLCKLAFAAQQNETSVATDQQQIVDSIHAMWSAIEQDKLDEYLKYIHDDYSVFGEGDVYLHQGKDKERRDIGDFINRAKGVRTFMHQPEITVRGDTAWITYYWNDAGMIGDDRYTSRGKSTRIFVKENSRWLCIHSHFTAIP
jgi:ketosteroid isomerase-like protein